VTSAPLSVKKNASVIFFSSITVTGELFYCADENALLLMEEHTDAWECLSVNLEHHGLTPKPGHVFLKDWNEGHGVAASLSEAGLVELGETHAVGPFDGLAYEARVIV
jgi:predicted GNAT family acetyltransferase